MVHSSWTLRTGFEVVTRISVTRFVCLGLIVVCLVVACDDGSASLPRLLDLDGHEVDPFAAPAGDPSSGVSPSNGLATVLLFVRTDCPIANRYAPEIQRIHSEFNSRGVQFWLVYPDPDETPDGIRQHIQDFGYTFPVVRDVRHTLVRQTGAKVTPEAAVFRAGGELVYCGRIDDRYVDFGQARTEPRTRELRQVVNALLERKEITLTRSAAVGCPIAELE